MSNRLRPSHLDRLFGLARNLLCERQESGLSNWPANAGEAGLGKMRGWFGISGSRQAVLTEGDIRANLVDRSRILRVNSPSSTRRDREALLVDIVSHGQSVPLHWLSHEARQSAERLQLKGLAKVFCDEDCTRYLIAT